MRRGTACRRGLGEGAPPLGWLFHLVATPNGEIRGVPGAASWSKPLAGSSSLGESLGRPTSQLFGPPPPPQHASVPAATRSPRPTRLRLLPLRPPPPNPKLLASFSNMCLREQRAGHARWKAPRLRRGRDAIGEVADSVQQASVYRWDGVRKVRLTRATLRQTSSRSSISPRGSGSGSRRFSMRTAGSSLGSRAQVSTVEQTLSTAELLNKLLAQLLGDRVAPQRRGAHGELHGVVLGVLV